MRIVAGVYRGLKLVAPEGKRTRPTTDRVREAVFNALGSLDVVHDATVLDAFAGSGALGLEALSRGAAKCTFVERDRAALRALNTNIATLRADSDATVIAGDARTHLASTATRYQLVLLDPPHDEDDWPGLLQLVHRCLDPDGLVVLESDRPVVTDDDPTWGVTREKRYGGTVVQMVGPLTPHSEEVASPR